MGATQTLASANLPQMSGVGIQSNPRVLDSFHEAFLSRPKRSFPQVLREDSYGTVWRPVAVAGEHFGSELFFHPAACSTSAPPLAFPHLTSSVLSPPLTPLPPSSHSPAVTSAHSPSWAGDRDGPLHFFASRPQQVPSLDSFGVTWPLAGGSAGTGGITVPPPALSHPAASSGNSTLKSHRAPRHAQRPQAAGGAAYRWKNQIYTGTPFPSILHPGEGTSDHYTPRPLLNPARKGTGLYSTLLAVQNGHEDKCGEPPRVNIGSNFQAELPALCAGDGVEESNQEQCLWKSWKGLRECRTTQEQVEKLLVMCNSSCLPGGGSNTELALHTLHSCQGDVLAALEKLLRTGTSPAADYHYAGCDVWTETEKSAFNAALRHHGKNFPLIHKTVETKMVSQCVEFYYLNNKLRAKQMKQSRQEIRDENGGEPERGESPTRITCAPSEKEFGPMKGPAKLFPCIKCGKMFYKVKSRNAHMKIHRNIPDGRTHGLKCRPVTSVAPGVTPAHRALGEAGPRPPPAFAIVDVGGFGPPYVAAFDQSRRSSAGLHEDRAPLNPFSSKR
ncbi:zinc finger protein 541-like [Syngnathoides biaculeatus]|uniref:zinc finger protein 541-like n=1 Tax=Syngnathoides biaculeatus TaxID=300417 RepID=UPI002ADE6D46|nr:zinc finger protein 541-like [Syngnathoides biaculeatus]